MKANQIESCQKYLLVKTYEWHKKKALHADLIKKASNRKVCTLQHQEVNF